MVKSTRKQHNVPIHTSVRQDAPVSATQVRRLTMCEINFRSDGCAGRVCGQRDPYGLKHDAARTVVLVSEI